MGQLPESFSTVEDFLANDAFRTWVLARRPEDRLYWQAWLAQHPDKREVYEQSVATLLVLQGQQARISDQQVQHSAAQILTRIPDRSPFTRSFSARLWGRWAAAAAVVGLISWWQVGQSVSDQPVAAVKQSLRNETWKVVKNETTQPLIVLLPDNSSVLLSMGSELRFRRQVDRGLREVFLQGEGFFEVTKNPARPFIVYTASLTTKVLGTSFQVRSFAKETTAYVKVKTGNVSVTPVASPTQPILLKVNEQVQLDTKQEKVVRQKTSPPTGAVSTIINQQFTFDYTAVPEVLDLLEASYHMPIQYDRTRLKNCTFTGQLNDAPFLEKIRLICLTIESTYEITDNQVIIHSNGCH